MLAPIFKLVFELLGVLLFAHLSWSILVASSFDHLNKNRPPNLTKYVDVANEWEPLLLAYWNSKFDPKKPSVVFLGSSVTYGYPWNESVIFTNRVSRQLPGMNVINLSYIGADIWGMYEYLMCPLNASPNSKPEMVFIEIPLVNSISQTKIGPLSPKRKCNDLIDPRRSYFDFIFERPIGLGWIHLMFDRSSHEFLEKNVQLDYVGDKYFATSARFAILESAYRRDLDIFLTYAASLGDKVFVFISPIYLDGVSEVGGEYAAVKYQLKVTDEVCKLHASIKCLSLSNLENDRSMFYNVTHLNIKGNKNLSNIIIKEILKSNDVSVHDNIVNINAF